MRKQITVFIGLAIACLLAGCATTSLDTNTIESTAVVIRGAARDGAVVAIEQAPETKQYFELAAAALGTFATGRDLSPGEFQKALLAVHVNELNNIYVQIAVGTAVDLYQLYFGQYVKASLDSNNVAAAFVGAVQDGFNQALGKQVILHVYVPPANTKLAGQRGLSILPRPLER